MAIKPVELRELIERLETAEAGWQQQQDLAVHRTNELVDALAKLKSAEARCAELQSHQDDYDRAHAGIEAAERDAARYRWIRSQSHLSLVVVDRSAEHIDRLVDEMMREPT